MFEAALDVEKAGQVVEQLGVEGLAAGGDFVGELDVVVGGDGGEQVEALEDEADLGAAEFGALRVREAGEVLALDGEGTGGGLGEAAEDVEERRFTGA